MAIHTHTQATIDGAGDALWYARTLIADVDCYDDAAVAIACKLVIKHAPDETEQARAADLLTLIQGEHRDLAA